MKRYLSFLTAFLLSALLAFVACVDPVTPETPDTPGEEETPGNNNPDKPEVVKPVFPEAITEALEAGGEYTLELEPNTDWSVELKYDDESAGWFWLKDNDGQFVVRGKAGEKVSITVCAGEESDFDAVHTCTLEMTMGEETKTIATFTRGTIERSFTLAYCKVEDNGGDYIYNETEGSSLQYEYDEPLAGEKPVIPLKWLERTKDYRRSILIDANFDWQLKSKPDWLLDLKVVGGSAGEPVELELEGDPINYPLEDAEAELVFCAKDNRDAAYTFTVQIPGCGDVFAIGGFNAETQVDAKGQFYKESAMGGSWMPAEYGIDGTVLGIEGAKVYAFSYVIEEYATTGFWDISDWITVSLADWNPENGVLQERMLNIKAAVNAGEEREGYVLAMPADAAPAAGEEYLMFCAEGLDEKYLPYVVTHITQAAKPASVYALDPIGMEEAGALLEKGTELWTMTSFKVSETFNLTYTNPYSADGSVLIASEDHKITKFEYYDFDLGKMSGESSWLAAETLTFEEGAFRVYMYPEKDKFGSQASVNAGHDHMGFIVIHDENGPFASLTCFYDDKPMGGETANSVSFMYNPSASDATLVRVTKDNLTELMDKYAEYELALDQDITMGETYILTYFSENQGMNALAVEGFDPDMFWNYYPTGTWLECEASLNSLSVFMNKPAEGQDQFGRIQMVLTGNKMAFVYCIPELQ